MRTTLNVDDDILDVAKNIALVRQISVGQALSDLARRGMKTPVGLKRDPVSGFWVFDVPEGASRITSEDVQRALDSEDLESAESFRQS
jgi:hypothetical protein